MIDYAYVLRFLIGLAIALAYLYAAFEYKSPVHDAQLIHLYGDVDIEGETLIPIVAAPEVPTSSRYSPIIADDDILETEEHLLKALEASWQEQELIDQHAFPIPQLEEEDIEEESEEEENIMVMEIEEFPIEEEDDFVCIGIVEESATPKGGFTAFYRYLKKQLSYPKNYQHIGGQLHVSFIVERNGSISNIQLLNSLHPIIDEAVLTVFAGLPKWKPGIHRGRAIRQRMTMPIRFDCGAHCDE